MRHLLLRKELVISFLFLCITFGAKAQYIKGAAIVGVNFAQVDGDRVYGFSRYGFNIGAAAIIPIKNWDITLETLFSQKGAYENLNYYSDVKQKSGSYDLRLNYVEVPLLVHYTDKKIFTLGGGFSYSRLLGSYEKELGETTDPAVSGGNYNENDYNIIGDITFRVWKNLHVNGRYSYSLTPIKERVWKKSSEGNLTRKQYNNTASLRFIWVFGDEQVNDRIMSRKKN
ncbi:MAG: porin family protein [Bacteroidales bacterium]